MTTTDPAVLNGDPTPAPAPDPTPTPTPAPAPAPTPAPTPAPVVPEKYDLKPPEGVEVDAAFVTDTSAFAKENGMTQEAAQKLFERRIQDRTALQEQMVSVHTNAVQGWAAAAKVDPEIAGKDGSEFANNAALANKALSKFGSPELIQALKETGYGNHPELIRTFVRIGKAMSEDNMHIGGGASRGNEKDAAELLYGNSPTN